MASSGQTQGADGARILVAGASGQLAPAVIAGLARAGFAPVLLTRSPLPGETPHESIVLPSWTPDALAEPLRGAGIGGIINLAAAGVRPGQSEAGALFAVNVALNAALIAAAPQGLRAFVNIGSGSEYAGGEALLTELAPLTTSNPYGLSKAAAGLSGLQAAAERGIAFAHLRLFGAFGENEAGHRLLPSLARQLPQGEAVPLSDGRQLRDWLYEEDIGDALAAAFKALMTNQMRSGFYNLGSGRGLSVRFFAETVADLLDAPRELLRFGALDRRPGEGDAFVADVSAFTQATGWSPRYTLEGGLATALQRLGLEPRQGSSASA